MTDQRNPDYPPCKLWDDCEHEWVDCNSSSATDLSVKCSKCGVPGEREKVDAVYWPTT